MDPPESSFVANCVINQFQEDFRGQEANVSAAQNFINVELNDWFVQVPPHVDSSGQRWSHIGQERSQDGEAQVISDAKLRTQTKLPLDYRHP